MLKLQYFVFSALLSKQTTGGKFDVRKLASGKREKKRLRTPTLEETLITKEFARFDNNDSEPKSQVRLL